MVKPRKSETGNTHHILSTDKYIGTNIKPGTIKMYVFNIDSINAGNALPMAWE